MLRGCTLKNTKEVVGFTVYTGHDTKVMMNGAPAKFKFSELEKLTNYFILCILGLQVILASLGGFVGSNWVLDNINKAQYLESTVDHSGFYLWVQFLGTWVLIFTNFVPISLMVTVELVKFWQASFMTLDHLMFDKD